MVLPQCLGQGQLFEPHNNIHATRAFLLRFFENLLLGKQHDLSNRTLHVQYAEPQNASTNRVNDPVNDPVNRSILQLLKLSPKANYADLAKETGCSTSTIKRHIQELKKQGKIVRERSDKTGYWNVQSGHGLN